MSKIAVAVFNRKGGVGKTTIAVILAQIALVRHNRVLAIDLDPSGNFTSAFGFLKNSGFKNNFRTKNTLEDSDADAPEEWIVIDCPPTLDDSSKHAIEFADITVIPVRPDYFSLSPLGMIASMAEKKYAKSRSQLPLVKIGFDSSSMAKVANQIISDNGYPVAEDIPLHKSIPYNITSGRIWSMGLTARSRTPYEELYAKILTAVDRLSEGITDIHEVWAAGRGEEY
ncbi:MAG: ParA family protein [Synergistaceae bacterium]|nr:ParA family protein [Synergistaceae bacterium]